MYRLNQIARNRKRPVRASFPNRRRWPAEPPTVTYLPPDSIPVGSLGSIGPGRGGPSCPRQLDHHLARANGEIGAALAAADELNRWPGGDSCAGREARPRPKEVEDGDVVACSDPETDVFHDAGYSSARPSRSKWASAPAGAWVGAEREPGLTAVRSCEGRSRPKRRATTSTRAAVPPNPRRTLDAPRRAHGP